MLRRVADELWDAHHPHKLMGIFPLGHRMALVRQPEGVLLYSPVPLTDALADEIAELGPVRHVIAPSTFHNLFLEAWAERYPDATFWAVPGFREKYPKLRVDRVLEGAVLEGAVLEDGAEIAGLRFFEVAGMPKIREHVALHERSRSLLIADLVFHFPRSDSFALRMLLKMVGAYGGVAVSKLFRSSIRDRAAVRASLDRILGLDWDRIVVGHGEIVEEGAKERLRDAYAWLKA